MEKIKHLTGKKFGEMTAVNNEIENGKIFWKIHCDKNHYFLVEQNCLLEGVFNKCPICHEYDKPKLKGVYFITDSNMKAIKIGFSNDIEKRVAELQTGNPCELKILGWLNCDKKYEKVFHQKIKNSKIKGEWFEWQPARDLMHRAYIDHDGGLMFHNNS